MVLSSAADAQSSGIDERIEPGAGAWRTWVLSSGSQFRPRTPPDAAATRAEFEQLRAVAAARDVEARDRIAWWNAAALSYHWNRIAMDEALRAGINADVASRHLALLHTMPADATTAAWDSKYAHNRPRPAAADLALLTATAAPPSPPYPDEHAVAGAAAVVLGEVFQRRAAEFTWSDAARRRVLAHRRP